MTKRKNKGIFTRAGLPVAADYPVPPSRRPMVAAGGIAMLVILGWVLYSHFLGAGRWASKGRLSSNHAVFGADCRTCHEPGARQVTDERCASCHEKHTAGLGVFTHATHYVYRSDDFRRVVPRDDEEPCFACHVEHEGLHAEITRVPDERCSGCHFASFGDDHPEFDFAAEPSADSSALAFAHVHHVREVMKRLSLDDVERACLACHEPQADGRRFEPISFDRHCDACHLTATTATPGLPLAGADGATVGVETLEQIVAAGGPGTRWAYFTNPGEFRQRGSVMVKAPVHHLDPWVLENLRRLRRRLYPDAGLADLLRASPDAAPHEGRVLYREAIATLEEQMLGLRGRPEPAIQQELARIGDLLDKLKREVDQPFAPLDESEFLLALERRDETLPAEEVAALEEVVGALTEPCRQCHQVRAATIVRVEKDQRELRRAEFDHRAHVVQAGCLDCHGTIPVAEYLEADGEEVPAELDRAEIHHLPRIERCRECHAPRQASDRCVTCHFFHPDKSHHGDLTLAATGETR